jgi:hypothetical protein
VSAKAIDSVLLVGKNCNRTYLFEKKQYGKEVDKIAGHCWLEKFVGVSIGIIMRTNSGLNYKYIFIYGVHNISTVFQSYVYNSEVSKFPFINFVIDIGCTSTVLVLITPNSVKNRVTFMYKYF